MSPESAGITKLVSCCAASIKLTKRAESAAQEGQRYAACQWGLGNERLQHPRLLAQAASLGMPAALVRVTIRA